MMATFDKMLQTQLDSGFKEITVTIDGMDKQIVGLDEKVENINKQIKGFAMPDAILTGVETRTSSPICIKRGEDFQSINHIVQVV